MWSRWSDCNLRTFAFCQKILKVLSFLLFEVLKIILLKLAGLRFSHTGKLMTLVITPKLLSRDFQCRLLITFANSLEQYQDQGNISPDLDPYHLTLL